jgi:hypothetical protein
LNLSGEVTLPLNGNHLEIVKFYSKEDSNYAVVAGNISKLNKTIALPPKIQGTSETT